MGRKRGELGRWDGSGEDRVRCGEGCGAIGGDFGVVVGSGAGKGRLLFGHIGRGGKRKIVIRSDGSRRVWVFDGVDADRGLARVEGVDIFRGESGVGGEDGAGERHECGGGELRSGVMVVDTEQRRQRFE